MYGNSSFVIIAIALALLGYLRGLGTNPFIQLNLYGVGVISLIWAFKGIINHYSSIYRHSKMLLLTSLAIGLVLLYQYETSYLKFSIINELGRLLLPLISVAVVLGFLKGTIKLISLQKLARIFIFLLLVDCLYRLFLNGGIVPYGSRYSLKFGGLLFVDANFNGWISAIIYLFRSRLGISKRNRLILLFLIVYSFSLAVYGGLLLIWVIRYFRNTSFLIRLILSSIIVLLVAGFVVNTNDGSFMTKIDIATSSLGFISGASWDLLLFGLGSGNLKDFFGHGSHTMFGIAAEMGLVFMVFWFYILHKSYRLREVNKYPIIFILFTGMFSLWPVAYMSLPLFLFFINVSYD